MTVLSISRAWDESKAVVARDGRLLATVALALFVLPGVVADVVTPQPEAGELPSFGLGTVLGAIVLLITLVGQLAVIRLAIGPGMTVGQAIAHAFRRSPAYIAASILWLLPFLIAVSAIVASSGAVTPQEVPPGIAAAILLLVPVMIFLAVRMMISSPVAAAESGGPIAILKRSWQLTAGHWWRLFGFFVLFLIAMVVIMAAVGTVMALLARLVFGELEPLTLGTLIVSLVSQTVGAVVSVMFVVMLARIYVQLSGGGGAEVTVPHSGS